MTAILDLEALKVTLDSTQVLIFLTQQVYQGYLWKLELTRSH